MIDGVRWGRLLAICFALSATVFALDIAFHALVVPDLYAGYPQRAQGGVVINISSLMGQVAGPFTAAYSASKHAVVTPQPAAG